MSDKTLHLPLPETETSEYILVPLTPSDNQPNTITDILVVHTTETNELNDNSSVALPMEPSTATVILPMQEQDLMENYQSPEEGNPANSLKRYFSASPSGSDNSNKKMKLKSRSPPHELAIYNNHAIRPNSISYSPLHQCPGNSFSEFGYDPILSSPIPRPRGRPIGSGNSKTNSNPFSPVSLTPTDEANFKRRPGRPRKFSSGNQSAVFEINRAKNPRGRPRLGTNKSRTTSTSTGISNPYEYGTIVWGKIKSCEWWPGMVISPRVIGKSITPLGCQWVTWHGEYQYSDVLYKNIKPIVNFFQFFTPLSFENPNYCEAIFRCIEIANNRTEMYKQRLEDRQDYDFSTPAQFDDLLKDRCVKDKQRELKLLKSLTQDQQNKLAWALMGFPPYGTAGLCIRSEDELSPYDPCPQMLDSGSEIDSEPGVVDLVVPPLVPQESRTDKERKNNQVNIDLLRDGKIQIQNLCLGCHKHEESLREHPLIEGGFCDHCLIEFQACFYLFDGNGEQEYCSICAAGDNVVICCNSSCFTFCQSCIQDLISSEEKDAIINKANWYCFLCQQADSKVNIALNNLKVRPDWNDRLHAIFNSSQSNHVFSYRTNAIPPPVPAKFRKPIRVLGLFDGISTSMLALKELGFEIEYYIASEIDPSAQKIAHINHLSIKHVGDIKNISLSSVESWGPFDLVCGGPPTQDICLENQNRRGLYDQKGTGPLFFEFYRILNYCFPKDGDTRPFFWFFETTYSMKTEDRDTISRFLAHEPMTIQLKEFSALDDCSYLWSNLPGLKRPKVPGHNAKLRLQDCLTKGTGRNARMDKIKPPPYRGSRSKGVYPVRIKLPDSEPEDDNLFVTELEDIHSLPKHYTDVGNASIEERQSLIESSWCVPAIKYILAPLKGYFKSNTTTPPQTSKQ